MNNKDMPAMPVDESVHINSFRVGYTKREQAAITILSGLVSNQFNVNYTSDSLTDRAIELADKLFDKLEK